MIQKHILPAAAALALAAGPAAAQGTTPPPGPVPGVGQVPAVGTGLVPNASGGFVTTVVPNPAFPSGVQPLFTPGLVSPQAAPLPTFLPPVGGGVGIGFFGPFGPYPTTPAPAGGYGVAGRLVVPSPSSRAAAVPTIGVNVAPPAVPPFFVAAGASPGRRMAGGPRISAEVAAAPGTRIPTERVAGRREELPPPSPGPVEASAAGRRQDRLGASLERSMEAGAMIPGVVTGVEPGGVRVRYESEGRPRTVLLAPEAVFFFRREGGSVRLATAATEGDAARVGTRVLVPDPGR